MDDAIACQRWLAEQNGAARTVAHIAAGKTFSRAPQPTRWILPNNALQSSIQAAAIGQMWRNTSKISLLMNPTLTEELLKSTSDKVPTSIFRRLPYINPRIDFAEPIPSTTVDGQPSHILGYYLAGANGTIKDYDSMGSSADCPVLAVMAISTYEGEYGPDFEFNRVGVPIRSELVRLPDLITELADNWICDELSAQTATRSSTRECITHTLRVAINTMLYLSATNAELDDGDSRSAAETEATPRSRRGQAARKPTTVPVGWRLGAKLRLARAEADERKTPTGKGGWTLPPRQVSGHTQIYWTGPGRTIEESRYVEPYWTHKELIGLSTTKPTLVPVA